jgi:hypothetical protein
MCCEVCLISPAPSFHFSSTKPLISLAPSFHFSSTKPLISLAPSFHFSSTKPLISLAPSFPQRFPKIYTVLRNALVAPAPSRGHDNASCNIT